MLDFHPFPICFCTTLWASRQAIRRTDVHQKLERNWRRDSACSAILLVGDELKSHFAVGLAHAQTPIEKQLEVELIHAYLAIRDNLAFFTTCLYIEMPSQADELSDFDEQNSRSICCPDNPHVMIAA